MQGTKALADDKDLIVHRPLRQCSNISFDEGKTKLKKAKNRRPLLDDVVTRFEFVISPGIFKKGGSDIVRRLIVANSYRFRRNVR